MLPNTRLRIAIQKKGRLYDNSTDLLSRCGINFRVSSHGLSARCENIPMDILLVRDDDIPTLVMDGICDLGIVGENELQEKVLYQRSQDKYAEVNTLRTLGFGQCRLAIAFPEEKPFRDNQCLQHLRIATSYPHLLQQFLSDAGVRADVLTISGSVEIAPRLDMADAICDLVSSGRTLEENALKEVTTLLHSQAVLIQTTQALSIEKQATCEMLLTRMSSVLKAKESKYILFHAPKNALAAITELLPGSETPTVMPLEGQADKVAVHVVSPEKVFWETLEKLKANGASAILVLPIEKMMR